MSTGDRWQPPQIKEVQRFLDKGMSASAIAIKLGRTRCSVLGIIHRQKLTRPGVPTLTRISPPTPRRVRYAGYTRQPSQPPKSLPPPREIPNSELVAAMPNPKTLSDIRYGQTCTFPVAGHGADTFYCAAGTDGETYCLFHKRVMYQPGPLKRIKVSA